MYLFSLYVSVLAYMFVYYTSIYETFYLWFYNHCIYLFQFELCSKFVPFYINYAILDCLFCYMQSTYLFLTVPISSG